MSSFTPDEIAYLQSQRLGRLATVGPDGQPHVVPVSFRYNHPPRRRCRKRPGRSRAAPEQITVSLR
jgi:nitroimidazol reductase NimA-like FMN-containing flavoprotein (pyridoxamine 5'-phosphate oxidase superfamily)